MEKHLVSERTACSLVELSRAVYRYYPLPKDNEGTLGVEVIRMASTYGRYYYCFIASMMCNARWEQGTSAKVASIKRQEDPKIRHKQPSKVTLWFNNGSCMSLRATTPNHGWSNDFVFIREDDYDGKTRMLTLIDGLSRKCLTIFCAKRIGPIEVIDKLENSIIDCGIPEHIRSDNGLKFITKDLRNW
jgi:putative transposase